MFEWYWLNFLISLLVSNFKIFHEQTSPGMQVSMDSKSIELQKVGGKLILIVCSKKTGEISIYGEKFSPHFLVSKTLEKKYFPIIWENEAR